MSIRVVREGRHLRSYSRAERRRMRRVWRSGSASALVNLVDELRRIEDDRAPYRSIAEAARVSQFDVYVAVHRGDVAALSGNRW